MFHYTVETTEKLDHVIAVLEESLKEEQFGVLWRFNLHDKLKERGFDFEKTFVVLEVCNPAEANRVISENVLAGYFLPCKIVVYEIEGKTKVGLPRPSAMMAMMEDPKLARIAKDVEERLLKCIERVVTR